MAHRFLLLPVPVGAALLGCMSALAACAGTPTQAGEANNFEVTPTGTAAAEAPPKSGKDEPFNLEQEEQLKVALRRGGAKAANCIGVASDAKAGEGEVSVLFDGKIGKAVDVTVGQPWAGNPLVESCIKRAFIGEYVVPFEGKLEVPYTVKMGKTEAPADPKKGDPKKDAKKDPKKK